MDHSIFHPESYGSTSPALCDQKTFIPLAMVDHSGLRITTIIIYNMVKESHDKYVLYWFSLYISPVNLAKIILLKRNLHQKMFICNWLENSQHTFLIAEKIRWTSGNPSKNIQLCIDIINFFIIHLLTLENIGYINKSSVVETEVNKKYK